MPQKEKGVLRLGGHLLQYGLDTLEGFLQARLNLDHINDESIHCTAELLLELGHGCSMCDWSESGERISHKSARARVKRVCGRARLGEPLTPYI